MAYDFESTVFVGRDCVLILGDVLDGPASSKVKGWTNFLFRFGSLVFRDGTVLGRESPFRMSCCAVLEAAILMKKFSDGKAI